MKSIILSLSIGAVAHAQNATPPSPAPRQVGCIRNVIVHTMDPACTVIPDAAVVIGVDGRIERIVPTAEAPVDGVLTFDGQGRHLWPGFISSATTMGLIEVQQVRATDDRTEVGPFHPEVEAWVAVNPDSDLLAVARANGILGALVFPQGGRVSGTASMVRLNGWDTHDLVLRKDSGVIVRWPATETTVQWWTRSTPDDQQKRIDRELREVKEFFTRAKAYITARDAGSTQVDDLRFERLRPVLTGAAPIYLDASSAGQVASAVTWALAEGFKPVIVGGPGALEQADLLRAHDVPVIIVGVHRLPQWAHEPWDAPFTLPARLAEAGIRFSIATGDEPSNDRNLPHHAATAVAHGLPHDRAVASITRDAAMIAGVGDQLGSIVPGMRATVILCSGDPLDVRTPVEAAWIDGRRLDLSNHQTRMLEKYRRKYEEPAGR